MSSGCGDVLSLQDLKIARLHQLFEAEVITGRVGGVASGAAIDYATNPVTGQTQKTLPAVLRDAGFSPTSFDFTSGGVLGVNDRDKVVFDPVSKTWYSWLGALPHTIPAGTNPVGDGNWKPQTDPDLRGDLAAEGGANEIGAVNTDGSKTTVQQFLNANDSASYRDRCIAKLADVDYKVRNKAAIKVLFQGDSITAGYDVLTTDTNAPIASDPLARHATTNYPQRFAAYMAEQCSVPITPTMRAISGYTAKQAYENPNWQTNPNCDIVLLMYGLNDGAGTAGATHDSYMEYMEKLIRRFIDWGMGVVVMSLASGGYGSGNELAHRYARQIKNMSTVYGCAYFNANEVQHNREFAAVASDALHFNSNGYARLGDALASMFMGGGLMPHYRPVSSELTFWPGINSDQVAYYDAKSNISIGRAGGAYTLQRIVGTLASGQASLMSFSFYLDCEAAEVDIVGSWTQGSKLAFAMQQSTVSQNGPNVTYYDPLNHSSVKADKVDDYKGGAALINFNNQSAVPKHLGTISGRGWKTITFYNAQDGSSTDVAYIQGVTVRPVPRNLISKESAGSIRKGVKEVVMVSYPFRDYKPVGGGIPTGFSLSSIIVPLPFDLNGLTWNNAFEYFDCGFAKLIISGTHDGSGVAYYEALISKTAAGNDLTVTELKKVNTWGTVTATTGTKAKVVKTAANSVAQYMPLEDIYGIGDDSTFTPSTLGNEFGLFLKLTFTWPGAIPTGYYNVSLESFARGLGGAASLASI